MRNYTFTCTATSSQFLNQKIQVNKSKSFSNFAFETVLWFFKALTLFFCSMFNFKFRNKIGRFGKLILFTKLALPSRLRHILYNGFNSLPPVIEVSIFIPTWPTIWSSMFNIPKRISVSTYRLIASACKVNCFWIWKQRKWESNNPTTRLNW